MFSFSSELLLSRKRAIGQSYCKVYSDRQRRVSGTFFEHMELEDFPFDIQRLSVVVSFAVAREGIVASVPRTRERVRLPARPTATMYVLGAVGGAGRGSVAHASGVSHGSCET